MVGTAGFGPSLCAGPLARLPRRFACSDLVAAHVVRFVRGRRPVELRVLGCLLEKQRTTPDQYPSP